MLAATAPVAEVQARRWAVARRAVSRYWRQRDADRAVSPKIPAGGSPTTKSTGPALPAR